MKIYLLIMLQIEGEGRLLFSKIEGNEDTIWVCQLKFSKNIKK